MAKKRANGEGNIRKRKDGRWEGRYTAGHDPVTGKQIFKNGEFKSIAVVKPGKSADGQDYVDGISGGTITSQGVGNMLFDSLKGYEKFLTSNE